MSGTPAFQRLLRTWLKFSDASKFDDATWTPREAQEKKLLEIVGRNKDTAFGRDHGFGGVKSIEDYRAAVPMNTYETLTPYIDRVFAGEKNVLTADDPLMFATTSGTTGRAKYIPVTPSYMHEYSHGVHVHLYRIFTDFGDALEGKILVSSSSDEEGRSDGGLPYGAISGYVARTQPGAIKRFYALPYELSKVKEVESKYYLTLRYGAAADVRLLMTPNPSSLLLLADKLNVWAEELIHDIRKGGANPAYVPDGSPKRSHRRPDAPNPARADELQAILKRDGALTPTAVWPNLRLVSCWKGGTMPLYLRKLPAVFQDVPVRDLGYMASEGRGATPLVNSGAAGVLNVTSHFFEFVPEEQRDDPNQTFLTVRPARVEPRVLHLLHDLGQPVSLRHQRRRPGRRLLPEHAGDPVRPQGTGDDLDHRREADGVPGDRGAARGGRVGRLTTCSTSRPACSGASRRATRSTRSWATR